MANNFLNYINLSYNKILQQVETKLNENDLFKSFRAGNIAQVLNEIFAGNTDLIAYFLEQVNNESFIETANLKSSLIRLSQNIGYNPIRPVPAKTSLNIEISYPLPVGVNSGDTVTFTRFSDGFTFNTFNYLFENTYTYTFTNEDVNATQGSKLIEYAFNNGSTNVLSGDIPLSAASDIETIQGEIKTVTVDGSLYKDTGKKWQKHFISDPEFSNIFGDQDYGYITSANDFNFDDNVCKVSIEGTQFKVDRTSLLNIESVNSFTSADDVAFIKSTPDEGVSISFGDDSFARIGLQTDDQTLTVQYLATNGEEANEIGVINQTLSSNQNFLTSSLVDISGNLTFTFKSDIINGSDFESVESIRNSAPSTFYSLDRLVNKIDYIAYLKKQTSPINFKHAIVMGEQEIGDGDFVKEFNNVVLYSAIGDMYWISNDDNSTNVHKTIDNVNFIQSYASSVLEGSDYNKFSGNNSHINLISKRSPTKILKYLDNLEDTNNIKQLNDNIQQKSQITIKNIYLTPHIEEFKLTGTVHLKSFADRITNKRLINNSLYDYLNTNSGFNSEIYLSKLIEIIEEFNSVRNADIELTPVNENESGLVGYSQDPTQANFDTSLIIAPDDPSITAYTSGTDALESLAVIKVNVAIAIQSYFDAYVIENDVNESLYPYDNVAKENQVYGRTLSTSKMNFKNFYNKFVFDLYRLFGSTDSNGVFTPPASNSFAESSQFLEICEKVYNDLSFILKQNMKDTKGNIVNFSLPSIIPIVNLDDLVYSNS